MKARTAYQDVMNLTTFSRVLNHGTAHCAQCLISREQLYLYTIGLLFALQTHVILIRVAESQAGVRPVTGRPDSPGLPGRPARSDELMLLNNLLKIHG